MSAADPIAIVGDPRTRRQDGPKVTVGFVGTYPPTRCGIATFTRSLREAMGGRSIVVASVDRAGEGRFGPEVAAELVRGSRRSLERAADALVDVDVAIVQHEFGIYGGDDGEEIVDLLAAVDVPVLTVMHTILRRPSANQRAVVEELARLSEFLVVLSEAARTRLLDAHVVPRRRIRVIPHGARPNLGRAAVARFSDGGAARPVIATWGLLGPGKGIEYAIEAVACLRDLRPAPLYLVHGRSHPRVVEREGESYRDSLIDRARTLGVLDMVEFDDRYVDTAAVLAWIRAADVVLLPYRSREQVVSGVLVEALASGKPVVATRFPHAEELLRTGSGILVPHDDAAAMAAALRCVLVDPEARARMTAAACAQASTFAWRSVGREYLGLAAEVLRRRVEAVL